MTGESIIVLNTVWYNIWYRISPIEAADLAISQRVKKNGLCTLQYWYNEIIIIIIIIVVIIIIRPVLRLYLIVEIDCYLNLNYINLMLELRSDQLDVTLSSQAFLRVIPLMFFLR